MSENIKTCFIASGGFAVIASLTWFFSSRPRLFIRVFVPADELPRAARTILRDPTFVRGMRSMAFLQYGVAALFFLGTLVAWFQS